MDRNDPACWMLTASALMLAGLLVMSLRGRFAPAVTPAQAAMVATTGGDHVLMTARLTGADEKLLVIDNARHALLVYDVEKVDNALVPEIAQDLEVLFTAVAGPPPQTQPQRVPR